MLEKDQRGFEIRGSREKEQERTEGGDTIAGELKSNKAKGEGLGDDRNENPVSDETREGNGQIIVSDVSGIDMGYQALGERGGEELLVTEVRQIQNMEIDLQHNQKPRTPLNILDSNQLVSKKSMEAGVGNRYEGTWKRVLR